MLACVPFLDTGRSMEEKQKKSRIFGRKIPQPALCHLAYSGGHIAGMAQNDNHLLSPHASRHAGDILVTVFSFIHFFILSAGNLVRDISCVG